MYLCRRYTAATTAEIARAFGRNHPSVRNAIDKVERSMLERAPMRYQVEAISEKINEKLGS
jgi:chromosomal replication initiation ATPase DnaA